MASRSSPLVDSLKVHRLSWWVLALLGLLLSSCGLAPERDGPPKEYQGVIDVPDAVPRVEPRSPYGNPSSYVVNGRRYHTLGVSRNYIERGIASWYGTKFHGRRTSSGEVYDMYAMTAAHRRLPLPTYVEVINLENGRRSIVRVNDRGPFHQNRLIDLSYVAARKLGILEKGTGLVEIRAIDPSAPAPKRDAHMVAADWTKDGIGLYLQVGAFAYRANADRLKLRLRSVASAKLNVTEALSDGRTVYRVRYGPLASVEQADRLVALLVAGGFDDVHAVLE